MVAVRERLRYVSDSGVAWPVLPLLVVGSVAAGLGVAWGLKLAYSHGWYLIGLVPALGGLALGGVLHLLVGWAHCRNRWLAGALGLLVGLASYLGYYELCLVDELPPGFGWRVDLLPDYIWLRLQTDVAKDLGKPDIAGAAQKPVTPLNCLLFLIELGAMAGLAAGFSWSRARQAYCPELGQWMRREKALLPVEANKPLVEALETGRLADFVAATPLASDAQTASRLIVEYATPSEGSPFDYPIYATFEAASKTRWWHKRNNSRRVLVRQVELALAEVLALRPLFPKLTGLLAAQHTELRDLPLVVTPVADVKAPVTDQAQIEPVPALFRQRVRKKGYALWVNLIGLTTGIYFFGGGALAFGGFWLATEKAIPAGWAAVVVGAIACVWGGYTGLYCLCVPENRWISRRLRQEISQRPDALVDPRDPEAIYVSLIPREAFAKIQLTMSTDLLLLKLDEPGRRLVMEGDSDRYRIPAGAISVCEPQCFFHPIDTQHRNHLWMVRLLVHVDNDLRELLLAVDHVRWTPLTNTGRRRAAEGLCERINALRA